jgi:hypothetical protein
MLYCSCPEYEGDGWYYVWSQKEDFDILQTKRARRCCSCKELIKVGAECLTFDRYRAPLSDVEERICGEEVELAPYYMCIKCSEIFLNLEELRFCLDITYDMKKYLEEYWELTGFKKGGVNAKGSIQTGTDADKLPDEVRQEN